MITKLQRALENADQFVDLGRLRCLVGTGPRGPIRCAVRSGGSSACRSIDAWTLASSVRSCRCSALVSASPMIRRSRLWSEGSRSLTIAAPCGVIAIRSLRRSCGCGVRRTSPLRSSVLSIEVMLPVVMMSRSAITLGSSGSPAPSRTASACLAVPDRRWSSHACRSCKAISRSPVRTMLA